MSAALLPFPSAPRRFWLVERVPNGGQQWKATVMGVRGDGVPPGLLGMRGTICRRIYDASHRHMGLPIVILDNEDGGQAA